MPRRPRSVEGKGCQSKARTRDAHAPDCASPRDHSRAGPAGAEGKDIPNRLVEAASDKPPLRQSNSSDALEKPHEVRIGADDCPETTQQLARLPESRASARRERDHLRSKPQALDATRLLAGGKRIRTPGPLEGEIVVDPITQLTATAILRGILSIRSRRVSGERGLRGCHRTSRPSVPAMTAGSSKRRRSSSTGSNSLSRLDEEPENCVR